MDVNSKGFIDKLSSCLENECRLYQTYITLLKEEQAYLTRFNEEKLSGLSARRSELYDKLLTAQDRRLALMQNFPEKQGVKLRDLVLVHMLPQNARLVLPMIDQLRSLVKESQQLGKQHFQVLDFGLKMVHGLLSIFWSATQRVVKSYNRNGEIQQSYHPAKSRRSGVLKEA